MGRGRRGGGGFSGREDQYGGFGGSQDRDSMQFSHGRGGRGGGSGGSQTRHKAGHDLNFQRHVPKFLQQYSHLLGKGGQQQGQPGDEEGEDAPTIAGGEPQVGTKHGFEGWSDDEDGTRGGGKGGIEDDDVEAHALKRAMEENPELAKEFEGKLTQKLNQAKASEEKEVGNRAFAEQNYKKAIESFTKCIELDPQGEVYWSNRSAAHAASENWEAAAADARQAVQLKPKWGKAHHRLATAFYGLKLYSDAVESYRRALALEPDNQAIRKGLEKAEMMEVQHVRDRKHVFFNKKQKLAAPEVKATDSAKDSKEASQARHIRGNTDSKADKKAVSLSFADDE